MSYKKFNPSDLILNTMKAHPSCEFFIFDGTVYYNSRPIQSGTMAGTAYTGARIGAETNVRNVPSGHISLYEYNIDRPLVNTDRFYGDSTGTGSYITKRNEELADPGFVSSLLNNGRIYPFISKDSAGSSFKTISTSDYATEYQYGDVIAGTYPLSSSIAREYITSPSASLNKHFYSLKNKLNFYGVRSQHYLVSSSFGDKNTQTLNLISVPSIFFGSQIKPGSLSLKWYVTGSLVGELRDTKRNGELIQTGPNGSTGSGSVAGVVLYDEGFVALTGSWNLYETTMTLDNAGENPSWVHFGAGANDGESPSVSASFDFSFKGTSETQVMTMFAHAKRGEVNFSNNPTYLSHGQQVINYTSSYVYEENPNLTVVNLVSSSFSDFSASFERSVYISKVAVYDENRKLIGIATLANPILKEEMNDLTFKIKLDI
jgi:hypothetical protein